jgi:DNA polymerase III subunit gamma/tau
MRDARTAPAEQSAGPPSAGSRADFESVSQRWPEILEAVKGQRKVAWILLSNAEVHSVQDGVLTIRFVREGDVKGFSGSGCDRDLSQVMTTGFGLKLQVRAIFGTQLGELSASPPAADLAPHRLVSSAPTAPAQAAPPRSDPARSGPTEADPPRSGPAQPGQAQSDAGQSEPVDRGPIHAGPGQPGPARPDPAPADRAPADQPPAGQAASREDLTGMDLIKRELGGRIIAEIDEA